MDHILRYQNNPDVKMMVVLGEVRMCFGLTTILEIVLCNVYDCAFTNYFRYGTL